MADGIVVPLTGAGDATAKIATDDTGASGQVQIIKLAISADGVVTLIPADTTFGLAVDVKRTAALPAGTNAIGKLAANSGVDIGDVDVTSVPPRVRTADSIAVALQTDVLMNGLTALTPKFAVIDTASAGESTLVAAVTSKKIRVVSMFIVNGHTSTQTVRFKSGTGGTAITGQMIFGANGGVVLPNNPSGWFETAAGALLSMELAGGTTVDGALSYVEV